MKAERRPIPVQPLPDPLFEVTHLIPCQGRSVPSANPMITQPISDSLVPDNGDLTLRRHFTNPEKDFFRVGQEEVEGSRHVLEHSTTPSPAATYLARLSPSSRRTQAGALTTLARLLWPQYSPAQALAEAPLYQALTPAVCVAVRARLCVQYAPATARRILAALRGLIREAWRARLLTSDERDRLLDLPPIRGHRVPPGRCLSIEEEAALYRVAGPRDRALLGVLLYAGLRREEAARLEWDCQINDALVERQESDASGPARFVPSPTPLRGCGTVGLNLRVDGKGGKQRMCYIFGRIFNDFKGWQKSASPKSHEVPPGLMGPWDQASYKASSLDSASRRVFGLSSGGAVWAAVDRLRRRSGVARFSPHDLRRTYASRALALGIDLATVQAALGHADPRTTARYDRRGEAAQIDAAQRMAGLTPGSGSDRSDA